MSETPSCYYYDEQRNRCKCYVNENLDALLAENAKLRKLCRDMYLVVACLDLDKSSLHAHGKDADWRTLEERYEELRAEVDGMNATKKLRVMLDERGVAWWPDKYSNTCWHADGFEWRASKENDGKLLLGCTSLTHLTPEQAIAATVACIPETKYQMALDDARKARMDAERWERVANDHQGVCKSLKETNADLRRIIEDAATVGAHSPNNPKVSEHTCHDESAYAGKFRCSECKAEWNTENDELTEPTLWVDGLGEYPQFCMNCGARIEVSE